MELDGKLRIAVHGVSGYVCFYVFTVRSPMDRKCECVTHLKQGLHILEMVVSVNLSLSMLS